MALRDRVNILKLEATKVDCNAGIPRFLHQKSIKFECKLVDNHWDQLFLGLNYQFLSF